MVTSSVACLHARRNVGWGVSRHVCHLRHRETETEKGGGIYTHQHHYCWFPSISRGYVVVFPSSPVMWILDLLDQWGESNMHGWVLEVQLLSLPSPLLLRAAARARQINTSAQAPGQDGCNAQLCGCLLVRAFLQSISQLIEFISITKGFLLSLHTPIHGGEEGCTPDSPCNEVLGNANVLFKSD